jgi:hypothetical protein
MCTCASLGTGRYTAMSVSVLAVLIAAVYLMMFGNYRVNLAIDTPWYLSFSYNYCMKGTNTDVSFGVPFPGGMGGTVALGKLAAVVQCAALAPFNWSLVAANALSVAGVALIEAITRSPARTNIDIAVVRVAAETVTPSGQLLVEIVEHEIA